jgi:AAA domain-containing protein
MSDLLPPEIVSLEDVAPHPNILIFGKSGVGKTVFAGSDDRVLILNCENEGVLSAKRLGSKAKEWRCPTFKDFERAINWLKRQNEQGKEIPFDWVVVDTVSTLQKLLMRDILDTVVAAKPSRDADIPDRPEYLKNQLVLARVVKELNDLPVNTLWLAHVMTQTDPEGEEFMYPSVQGGKYVLAQQILAQMTSYGYMFVKLRTKDGKPVTQNGKRIRDRFIMWETSGSMQGKDRTNVLGEFTKNITLKEIRQRMEEADKKAIESREKESTESK